MPKGVEHMQKGDTPICGGVVRRYEMPKGVEHNAQQRRLSEAIGASI